MDDKLGTIFCISPNSKVKNVDHDSKLIVASCGWEELKIYWCTYFLLARLEKGLDYIHMYTLFWIFNTRAGEDDLFNFIRSPEQYIPIRLFFFL